MHISHLSLTNFRNFGRLELDLPHGATLLYGQNAQGKTNLLESIYYMATTRSPHTNQDDQLINWDAGQYGEPIIVGRLVMHVQTNDGLQHLEMRLIREQQPHTVSFRREALVNRRKVRLMDLLGNLRVVLFLPEDMQLVTGSPSARRRYLDITLCQSDKAYCRALSTYNKVLEQRNVLLRQLAENRNGRASNDEVLSIFSEKLVGLGSKIFARRALFLRDLAREVQRIHYESLTAGKETIRLTYLPRLQSKPANVMPDSDDMLTEDARWMSEHCEQPDAIEERFRQALTEAQAHDLQRGTTSVGPHRDDWHFWVNGRSLRHYGSRGQQRSAILALKLGEINWVSAETNEPPLLLLDDVMAELDSERRQLLLDKLTTLPQSLTTSADSNVFPASFLQSAHTLYVENGRIEVKNH